MTKSEYIKAHPKSYLADKLSCNNWPDNGKIRVGGGLLTPHDKRSNLYKALLGTTGEYVVGGHRWRGTEGWWWAVRI